MRHLLQRNTLKDFRSFKEEHFRQKEQEQSPAVEMNLECMRNYVVRAKRV